MKIRLLTTLSPAPAGFEVQTPSKRDLLGGPVALLLHDEAEIAALVGPLQTRVTGVIVTPGPLNHSVALSPQLWHLQLPPERFDELAGLLSPTLELLERLLNQEDERRDMARRVERAQRELDTTYQDYQRVTARLRHQVEELTAAQAQIQRSAGELRTLNQDLERRVTARTTELAEAKEAAEAANAAKSMFLAAMSHEVRTPMNGVIGMLELMLDSGLNNEQKRMLGTVRDSAHALLNILDDILDFSKIEAGRLELERIPVQLRQVVEGVAETLAANAVRKQLRLHCHVDPALPEWLLADPVRLRQILFNLGSNAIKFTETTHGRVGEILVWAELLQREGDSVDLVLRVRDNGIGMDESVRKRLFAPFSQGESSTTRRFGGTGLGLSICRRLTELMDGHIDVASAPGMGSTFEVHLRLPVASGPSALPCPLVENLSAIALIHPGESLTTLQAYLAACAVPLTCYTDLTGVGRALAAAPAGHDPILVVGPEWPEGLIGPWLASLRSSLSRPGLKAVLLTPRQEGSPPLPVGAVRVWTWPMQARELLLGLATAAGRAEAEAPAPAEEETMAATDEFLILVAEDNPINQEVIQRQIEHLGYHCLVADNGLLALEQWRAQPFHLLLTDCHMPEMDGFELVRQIRTEEAASARARTPIIAVTANAMRGEADRCLQAGMDDYLVKPLELATLRQVLNRWLGGRPSQAASPPQPTGGDRLWLPDRLNATLGPDPGIQNRLLGRYLDSSPEQLEAIVNAARRHDGNALSFAAHRLKSAARTVGSDEVGDLCERLETAGQQHDWGSIDHLIGRLQERHGQLRQRLETHLANS